MIIPNEGRPYAVHDIDGTLWRGALFTEVMNMSVEAGLIPPPGTLVGEDPTHFYLQDLHRRIAGRPTTMFDELYDGLAAMARRGMFDFTRPLLEAEQAGGLEVVLISHSPQQFVEIFSELIGGVGRAIGTYLPEANGRFNGEPVNVFKKPTSSANWPPRAMPHDPPSPLATHTMTWACCN